MQITHTHAENSIFKQLTKTNALILVINSIFKHNFLCIAISYEIIEIFYTNTILFFKNCLATILMFSQFKTKRNTLMNSFLIVKYKLLKENSQLLFGSVPSGTHMLGINKDHSPNSASLDVLMFVFLRWLNVFL